MAADRAGAPPKRRALLAQIAGRDVAALLAGDRAEDLLIGPEDPAAPSPGDVWAVRVDRLLAGRAGDRPGAFADLGGERLFLIDGRGLTPGEAVLARVLKAADPSTGKAATGSRKLELGGRLLTLTPGAPGVNLSRKITAADCKARLGAAVGGALASALGPAAGEVGAVIRSRATDASAAEIADETTALARIWAALRDAPRAPPRRLWRGRALPQLAADLWDAPVGAPASAPSADAERLTRILADALAETAPLAAEGGGAWMALTRTPAAIVIDVNAGAARSASAVNLAAAAEIPRQLRLRGWGGAVLIDFVGSAAGDRSRIERQLKLRADGALEVVGWGPVGFLEAVRRGDRVPVDSAFARGADGGVVARRRGSDP